MGECARSLISRGVCFKAADRTLITRSNRESAILHYTKQSTRNVVMGRLSVVMSVTAPISPFRQPQPDRKGPRERFQRDEAAGR
jgi:hypothetical protein